MKLYCYFTTTKANRLEKDLGERIEGVIKEKLPGKPTKIIGIIPSSRTNRV